MNSRSSLDTVYDENSNNEIAPNKNTVANPTPTDESQQPLWKANLSRRWSKKQPTKGELCDTFLDMKHSRTVQSNNNWTEQTHRTSVTRCR